MLSWRGRWSATLDPNQLLRNLLALHLMPIQYPPFRLAQRMPNLLLVFGNLMTMVFGNLMTMVFGNLVTMLLGNLMTMVFGNLMTMVFGNLVTMLL
jgi:hypothetical protein